MRKKLTIGEHPLRRLLDGKLREIRTISVWADCRQILRIEDGKTVIAKDPARPPRLVSIHANDDSTPVSYTVFWDEDEEGVICHEARET